MRGKGMNLPVPPLPISQFPVHAQLQNSDGACWEATYSAPLANTPQILKAKSD